MFVRTSAQKSNSCLQKLTDLHLWTCVLSDLKKKAGHSLYVSGKSLFILLLFDNKRAHQKQLVHLLNENTTNADNQN